ncbi:MAG: class I SAM-dependent methyltransferase [Methanosarcinaceae archaeon]|nr:class I SAM-dependent methyltransferase [Methanosarcinaceae archaeon]
MKTNMRMNLENKLIPILKQYTKGEVLEVGSGNLSYKKYVNYTDYKTLDVNSHLRVDFCEDIHETTLSSESFDTVLMIEVLEHLYNPFTAIKQVNRLLRKGGYVVVTTPFIYPYHGTPHDFYRYTKYGLMKIFDDFEEVKIVEYGNVFGASLDILTSYKLLKPLKILNILISSKIFDNTFNTKTPTGCLVIAEK